MELSISRGKYTALIDSDDIELVNQYRWHITSKGYVENHIVGMLHRLIMKASKDKVVDHINRNPLDNRKSNLRLCYKAENCRNRKKQLNTSGYKGVNWNNHRKGAWIAHICFKYRDYNLGRFKDVFHAAMARDIWAKELHGEYADLNFPNGIFG